MSLVRPLVFVVASAGIVAYSWRSLADPRSHGFPRCFAFESLLTLILLNVPGWFHDPWSPRQIASWVLLCGALALAIHGFVRLVTAGKPRGSFEDTTVLVVSGAYRWIRHPLYASVLYLTWGVFLKGISALSGVLAAAATVFLVLTALNEERENLARFGGSYRTYMTRTRRFVPYLF